MAGKVKRLSKIARELNVSTSTIVEFLASKGIDINASPNTKIEAAHHTILSEEFADDQTIKEEAEKKTIQHEKRETVSIKTKQEKDEPTSHEEDDVPEIISLEKQEVTATVEEDKPTEIAEEKVKEEEIEVKVDVKVDVDVEEVNKADEAPKEKENIPEEHVKEPQKEEKGNGPRVLGKIDLASINAKTRPSKKKKPSEKPKKDLEKKVKPSDQPKQEKPVIQKKEEEKSKKEEPKKPELIRTRVQTLSGPKVVGTIELPKDDRKKKKDKKEDNNKRKRKRIKKVDVNKQPAKKHNNKKKPAPKKEITEKDIEKEIKETLARLSGGNKKAKKGVKNRRAKRDSAKEQRERDLAQEEQEATLLKLTEFVSVSELATMMNVQSTEVISACMSLGIFASINQRLDAETIQIVADEFGFEVEFVSADVQDSIPVAEDKPEDLEARPPIITVMGHVDHGKTSLLDYIRHANIASGEAGGITQHIGAYSANFNGRQLTFLDTPGHEAFTAMRARGAQVTDVAIIIVAADDDVMPQTKEAISHAQAAGVPMVFAINKIDKPGANPDKIKEQLSGMNILVEEWGGKHQSQDISAKKGVNIEELIEKVILEADLLELKANPNKDAVGTVLESSLDKGKGYVTNLLVEGGTLHVGDIILAGRHTGRVRAMHNEKGEKIKEVSPSCPVSIIGIDGAPSAGDKFYIMKDEKEARNIATRREQLHREQGLRTQRHITLDEIGRRLAIGDFQELNVIIKGDVDGSIEALSDSILKLSTEEIQVNIIHKAVGAITEADVNLAVASDAIIIGFQVRPTNPAKKLADEEQIDIRLYSVIYKAIDELKSAMEGMLSPDIKEIIVGTAEIRETFKISKIGTIAGCFVTSGYIKRNSKIRVIRDGIVIHEGGLGSLKRFKDDVKEVKNNYECGLNVEKFNDVKEGDIIEAYEEEEVARKL